DGGVDQRHLAQVAVVPEQEHLADPAVVAQVESGIDLLEVVVDIDDVSHGPRQGQGLLEGGSGMEQERRPADLPQHVASPRVVGDQVLDHRRLVGLPAEYVLELVDPSIYHDALRERRMRAASTAERTTWVGP